MSAILPNDHRTSCHRCGNIRKNLHQCSECPQVFCSRCKEKMVLHHGIGVFAKGCPVCKNLCCCGQNRSLACTQQFHCYKKCPTTRLGGINFGVCTPSPTEIVKYSQSRGKRTVQHSEEGPSTPAAYYSNNTHMPVAMAVSDDRLKYSDNLFQVVKAHYAEEGASDIPRDDHGSVDDIEHFFISADDWDRSQFTGSTRFYEEQNSAEEEDYVYGTSSASMVISTAYADNAIKDIYPFLSTPTPTSPAPQSPRVRTSPARTERTSSLPLPSAQVHFYHNARVPDGMIDTVRAVGVTDAKLQIDSCSHRLHEEVTCRASNHPKPYICRPYANEKMLPGYGYQSLHQSTDIPTHPESADSKTASIAEKELKGKLSKPPHVLYHDQDVKTGAKCKAKKARSGSADNLIADPTTSLSRDSNLGPLESFLSSNYFIQDGLHDLTGPFFLQQSLHFHAKAPSLKELMSGLAATAATSGVSADLSGLTANGKKRYRKHPASISATKIKNEAQLSSQVTNRDRRKEARMNHSSQSSPSMHVYDADRQQPDEDMKLSSIHDRASSSLNREDMWTVLRGNSFKENATATENTSTKDNVYRLHERTNRDEGDSFTGHRTSSEIPSSSAATIRNGSYRIPHQISEYMDDRSEDDFGPGFSRGRPHHEDSRRPPGPYSDALEMTSVQGLSVRRSAALDHYPKSKISNREDLQEHGVLEYGVRHPVERASRQTSFQDIYDPFQKFDDYYVMGSDPGFREAAVPIVNNVCILGSPWKYSYFSSEESQKGYTQTRPCRARYESQNTSDSSSPAIDARSVTVVDCREVSIDVDVDAGVDELLISTLVEHIADDAEDSPNVANTVPNIFNESVAATAGAIKLTALMSSRAEGQGGERSAEASLFPVPTNVMYQYRVKNNQEIRSPKRLESSISNSSSTNGTPSKSNPPLENVSFSPFMNFTPESDAKAVEHMGTGFGSGISSGMAPFNILSVEPYNGEQNKGEKDQTVSVAASAAVVAMSRSNSDVVPESALGWLDYTYDFAAE